MSADFNTNDNLIGLPLRHCKRIFCVIKNMAINVLYVRQNIHDAIAGCNAESSAKYQVGKYSTVIFTMDCRFRSSVIPLNNDGRSAALRRGRPVAGAGCHVYIVICSEVTVSAFI